MSLLAEKRFMFNSTSIGFWDAAVLLDLAEVLNLRLEGAEIQPRLLEVRLDRGEPLRGLDDVELHLLLALRGEVHLVSITKAKSEGLSTNKVC